jgi:hypothetical protein
MLAMLTTQRLAPLAEQMGVFDVIVHSDDADRPNVTRNIEKLERELARQSFDVALALSYEADPEVRNLMAHTGARVRIGSAELGEEDCALNMLVRESERGEPYWKRMKGIFSVLGIHQRSEYVSCFMPRGEEPGHPLDFMRERHGEDIIGFLFDQVDPLDELGSDEIVKMTRTVMDRRMEKTVLSGFGLREGEVRPFVAAGGRFIEKESVADIVRMFFDCSWTITNSLGLAALIGGLGSRVVYVGKPSRLKKCPLTGLTTVAFLPITSGKVLIESLLRVMEHRYPDE